MRKSFLFSLHQISGLVLGIFLILISVSGALLVFKEELVSPTYSHVKWSKTDSSIGLETAFQRIRNLHPNAKILSAKIPTNSNEPYQFSIYDTSLQNQPKLTLTLNPMNGDLLHPEANKTNQFFQWLTGFHNSFQLKKWGEWLLGLLSVLFLMSLITGMLHYRKKIIAVLSFNKHIYRWNHFHQILGVWTLLFQIIIAGSGFWMQRYVFKVGFYQTVSYPVPKQTRPFYYPTYHLDSAISQLQKNYPDFRVSSLYFASDANSNTAIYGSRISNSFIHSKKLADAVFVDSLGNLQKTRFVTEISLADRIDIINAQIHYGQYGGIGIKIMYALLGLAAGILSITGFLMFLRKRNH